MAVRLEGWMVLVLAGLVSTGCESNGGASAPGEPAPQETASIVGAMAEEPGAWDSGPQDPLSDVDINAIKEAVKEGAERYRDGQFWNFANKFSNDGKLMPPNASPKHGKEAIETFAKLSPKITALDVTDIEVDGAGKKATVTASVQMVGETYDADNDYAATAVSSTGMVLIAMKKQGGAWLAKDVAYVAQ